MRGLSSAASFSIHIGLAAAVLLGTAKAGRSSPTRPEPPLVFLPTTQTAPQRSVGVPVPDGPGPLVLTIPTIPIPETLLGSATAMQPSFPVTLVPGGTAGSGSPVSGVGALGQEGPEVLTGPIPAYPELLRQAGIQGRVVLEAVVDTSGRAQPASVSVISATNPAFVAPARQALLSTLFRPALVGGRHVPMRVQIPYEFTIRGSR